MVLVKKKLFSVAFLKMIAYIALEVIFRLTHMSKMITYEEHILNTFSHPFNRPSKQGTCSGFNG